MPVTELITVEEYLSTAYSPDCGFVDGVLEDRHVGEKDLSKLQILLGAWLHPRSKMPGVTAFSEQRVQVSTTGNRLPDLGVTIGEPEEQIFTTPPLLCMEILSPEDQMGRALAKVADYLTFGVPYVRVIDPRKRRATIYTATDSYSPEDGILRTQNPDIALPLAELF
jgi:Uma2 family endonuclease